MLLQQNKNLLKYWNVIRDGRQAPKRIEITPSAISSILPVTFILEVLNREQLHFRLAGSRMCEIFGKEFRGLNFLDCWPSSERSTVLKHLSQLINEGPAVTFQCKAISNSDHTGDFEMLFLPLTHSGTSIDRILGSISPKEDYPWMGLTELDFSEIGEVQLQYFRRNSNELDTSSSISKLSFLPYKRLVKGKNCQLRVFDGGKED